mmetsp:Transcript_14936/g.20245  ORF Transcript_14936/g.20245 Transcript_14936/m.20245 type:complete len:80 (+) Transcript_14936:823-1062(+)
MEDLKQNIALGVYSIPKHVHMSASCLDFLNSCLRFESNKRKSWGELLEHPFMLGFASDGARNHNSLTPEIKGTIKINTK